MIRYYVKVVLNYKNSKKKLQNVEVYSLKKEENIDEAIKEFHNSIDNHIIIEYDVLFFMDTYNIINGSIYRNSRNRLVKKDK